MSMNPQAPKPTMKQRLEREFMSGRPIIAFVLGYFLAILSKFIFGS